jgi:hypothetical protein
MSRGQILDDIERAVYAGFFFFRLIFGVHGIVTNLSQELTFAATVVHSC